jgi:hypothetical protein
MTSLPLLPESWESTRATLHAYAGAVGAIPRAFGIAHPKWWHVSLKVRPTGLVTDPVPLPAGGSVQLRLDLIAHTVVIESSDGARSEVAMNAGLTSTELGDAVLASVAELGLTGTVDRSKFESDDPRLYDEATATLVFAVLTDVATVFERHRASIDGPTSPVQLWPHNFDLALDWFGTRTETYEEAGEVTVYPSQLNLGFYAGGETYFYSNPWPFERDDLMGSELPHRARWHTEGWEGTLLPYAELVGEEDGLEKLADYARAVFDVASPTLS